MLVSYNWLKNLVDIKDIDVHDIANRLTFAGVEVESVEALSSATNLVVGLVIKCEVVPDTHLHLCEVDLGPKYGVKQIICGAPNVRKDLKVIVARPGAKLPGGEIKVSTIRGYESNGMLCSLLELGIDSKYVSETDLTGIHELSDDFKVGDENVLDELGLSDTILNLKLLANRPDLYAMSNVAKEVSTLFEVPYTKLTKVKYKEEKTDFVVSSETAKCPQFSIRVVKGVKIKESPIELKRYLISMGVRPINNIVDIGNYIMLLTGQPLHMYDYDKLPKHELIVKDNYQGDFVALDDKTYALNKGDLVVTSNNKVMCLGGVMGGKNSANDDNTVNIVIEAANFDYASIRRASTRLNLISESSLRFAHGINPHQYEEVLELATALIKKYSDFTSVSNIVTYDGVNHAKKDINTNEEEINNILGTSYSKKEITDVLKRDHFTIKDNAHGFTATVPDHRIDIVGVNDLAEEVVRILGFKDVKNELPKGTNIGIRSDKQEKIMAIKNHLRAHSLYEVFTYVLVNDKLVNYFNYLNNATPFKLLNPMTDDHQYVRTSLMPSLIDVVSYNLAHQNNDFGIFEIADVNYSDKKETYLAIALTGEHKLQDELEKKPFSFFYLKGLLESVMSKLGIEKNRYQVKEWNLGKEEMHPTRSAVVTIGKDLVAYLGELHPLVYPHFGIKNNRVYVLEINLSRLLSTPVGQTKFKSISRYPSVTRDIAILVDKEMHAEDVLNLIKRSGGSLVKNVTLFDVYEDANLVMNKKSLAISITMLNENATLKDSDIITTIEKIKAELLKEGISIR